MKFPKQPTINHRHKTERVFRIRHQHCSTKENRLIYMICYLVCGAFVAISRIAMEDRKMDDLSSFFGKPETRSKIRSFIDNLAFGGVSIGLFSIFWLPLLGYLALEKYREYKEERNKNFRIQRNNLKRYFSISEIEKLEYVSDPLNAVPSQPFGHLNSAWKKYTECIKKDDLIYEFSTTWTTNHGQKMWGRPPRRCNRHQFALHLPSR